MKLDMDSIPGGLVLMDAENRVTAVNLTLCNWLKRDQSDLLGRSPAIWMTPASRMYYLGHVLPSLRLHGRVDEVVLTLVSADGENYPVVLSATQRAGNESGYQLLALPMLRRNTIEEQLQQARRAADKAAAEKDKALREVQVLMARLEVRQQELSVLNEQLEQLATKDPLTGLDNRRVFDREITMHLALYKRSNMPFSVMLADIDWFKQINDRHGHDAGDRVLQAVSRCLSAGMRDVDTVVRMGGEEFAFILPDTAADAAVLVAERKRLEVASLVTDYGGLTISFGVTAVIPDDTRRDLYNRADEALYLAKSQGRNQVCTR